MQQPFHAVLNTANKVITEAHQLANAVQASVRHRNELNLADTLRELSNQVERQFAVPMPACKPSYRDGHEGFKIDVKHALDGLLDTARPLVETAKIAAGENDTFRQTKASSDRAKLRQTAEIQRELERRLRDRINHLKKLQTECAATQSAPVVTPTPTPPVVEPSPPPMTTANVVRGLTRTEAAVFALIKAQPKGSGISGKEIITAIKKQRITLAESTLRRHIIPKLKTHGVVNHKAAGGYLIEDPAPHSAV